jgi:DHA1 family inner membrane transport protein
MMLVLTNLPKVGVATAVATVAGLMVTNAGRMVAAMSMVTSSVEPRRRGGFMSANSAVQHLATGLGAALGGVIVHTRPDQPLPNFPIVGLIAAASTLLSIWLAGRLRFPQTQQKATETTLALSLAAAAEANTDASEPIEAIMDTNASINTASST